MTRRLLIFAIVCAFAAGCRAASGPTGGLPPGPVTLSQSPGTRLAPDTNVNELPEPPVVKAVNGVATVSLIADINPATGLPSFEYEGLHGVAPTIEVKPGQRFVVDLTNDCRPAAGCRRTSTCISTGWAPRRAHLATISSSSQSPVRRSTTRWTSRQLRSRASIGITRTCTWRPAIKLAKVECRAQSSCRASRSTFLAWQKMKQRLIIVRATGIGVNARPHDDAAAGDSDDDMPGMGAMPMATARPLNSNRTPCLFYDGLNGGTQWSLRAGDYHCARGEAVFPCGERYGPQDPQAQRRRRERPTGRGRWICARHVSGHACRRSRCLT